MKVNKITTIACLIIGIISCILLIVFKDSVTLSSIFSGVFTGIIISLVVAVIGYFHERAKIIEAVDFNIRRLFLNITVMSKLLGNVLPNIHNSTVIQNLPFKNVLDLSTLNSEFIEKMNLGLYKPFFKNTKKYYVIKKLIEFNISIYTMNNYSSKLETQVLNHIILILEIQKNQMLGIPINPIQEKSLDDLKNSMAHCKMNLQ